MRTPIKFLAAVFLFASMIIASNTNAQTKSSINAKLTKADSLVSKSDLNYVQFLADDDESKMKLAINQIDEAIEILEQCMDDTKYDSKENKRVTELRDMCNITSGFFGKTSGIDGMKKNKSIKYKGQSYKVSDTGKSYYKEYLTEFESMWAKDVKKAMQ